ncbi:MAG: MBL fold metallo-hydrolase [Desulfobacteraceae bacterium]|jgi:glyoxylase-like metal-dependent hydrolase (beta-lactamase superfamily II)
MTPTLIEIKQGTPGFDRFISSWVCQGEKNIVIDVGPSNSVKKLVESLKGMGLDRVDLILLTHIHIDHGGGLGDFLEHFPTAGVICHEKGIKHLVDPSKLWAGSQKTLGALSETYGPIKPIKRERLTSHNEASVKGLRIVETPGHAPHHLSFVYEEHLFAGEAGGVYFVMQESEYLRPATPSIFLLKEFLESIDRLLTLEDLPICYSHFGEAESSHQMLKRARHQLIRWEGMIREEISSGESHLVERCMESLLEKDPELSAFGAMDPDDQERERFFMANSIRGYLGFLGLKK